MRAQRWATAVVCVLSLYGFLRCPDVAGQEADEEGFVALFDGQLTDGWRGYNREDVAGWVVDEGALHRASGDGDLMSEGQYDDFELRFEWKVAAMGNSGIMYRVSEESQPAYVTGPEYQVLDNKRHQDGASPLTSAGSLYGLYATDPDAAKPAGEYNSGRIVVRGNHVEHWLNGVQVVSCEIGSADWNDARDRQQIQ